MDYKVSSKTEEIFSQLVGLDSVKAGLNFIENDQENTIKDQLNLVVIEAPTFNEQKRAEAYKDYFIKLGLSDVHIDKFGNAVGTRKGTGSGENGRILVEAHLDTVFPAGTVIEPRREGDKIYAPGITDDTRGLAVLLSVIRALDENKIETCRDIVFVGTVEEEGIGGLGGMRKFLSENKDIEASISVDGPSPKALVFEAQGIMTFEVTFYGPGGHAGKFKVPNPIGAASRAVTKIMDIEVPDDPKTIYCVSNFHAGNEGGIHAFPKEATIKINIRSSDKNELEKLYSKVMDAISEGAAEETARLGLEEIKWDSKIYFQNSPATQDMHAPIIEAAYIISEYLGHEPTIMRGGGTNADVPVSMGIPAICIGMGDPTLKSHSLDEFFPITGAYQGVQHAFLLALMLAGVKDTIKPAYGK